MARARPRRLGGGAARSWAARAQTVSAADLAVYGQVHHLVGDCGDAGFGSCMPSILEDTPAPLLARWFDRMRTAFPIEAHRRELRS